MSPAEARLKEVPSEITEAEWAQRINLAACYRLVAFYGWDDLVDTHISARVPGPDHHFLINPYGLMFDEITASSLIKVDAHGDKLDQSAYDVNPAGFTIHSAVHAARHDAACVLHTHTVAGVAVSSLQGGLQPCNQWALQFHNRVVYHDYEGIALNLDERERLVADLGPTAKVMVLRNHGLLTVGRSVESAVASYVAMENAAQTQLLAEAAGRVKPITPEVARYTAGQMAGADPGAFGFRPMWERIVREQPDLLD